MNRMKKRISKTEQRAREMCEAIRAGWCDGLTVEWVKNRTWGMCPRIEWRGEIVSRATGCGYCKESTVLADALRHLATDDDSMRSVWRTGGCGPESTIKALEMLGWTLKRIASTKTTDTYSITRTHAAAGEEVAR